MYNSLVRRNIKKVLFIIFCLQVKETESSVNEKVPADKNKNLKLLRELIGERNKEIEKQEKCYDVTLKVSPYSVDNSTLAIGITLSDDMFIDCFYYFCVLLFLENKYFTEAEAKVPINRLDASHVFKNITCGIYDIVIYPSYDNLACNYEHRIKYDSYNKTGCIGPPAILVSQKSDEDEYNSKIIIGVLSFLLLVLVVVEIALHVIKLAIQENREQRIASIENGMHFKVYILHHYDEITLNKVKVIKDGLMNYPEITLIDIGEELHLQQIAREEWVDDMLQRSLDENGAEKKFIIINHARKMENLIHENENLTFWNAVDRISENFASRQMDYKNVLKVYFGDSSMKIQKLKKVVPNRQYLIRNSKDVNQLYHHLVFGSRRTFFSWLISLIKCRYK